MFRQAGGRGYDGSSVNKRHTIWLAAALLAICLAYANHFNNAFHFDDFHTIVDNPAIRSLRNVPRFFHDATSFSVLPANRTYRPIVSASLALDYALGRGYVPFWFHLSTFLLFLGEVLLLDGLYRLLLDRTRPSPANAWIALFGAAWFGLHPAMAETVNYVIQRGDLYCALGSVGALLLYARAPRLRRTGLYLLPFALALLSKPPAAVFPVLLLLYVFFFEEADAAPLHRLRRGLVAMLPSVAVAGALLWLQVAMTPRSFAPSILSPWDYRLTQPFVWARYAGELFLPLHLNVDTDLEAFSGLNLRAVVGLVFLAALLVAIWMTARRRVLYPIAFGLLWFVVTQLPTSLYPLSEVENDHRMFFSFAGLILAATWGVWLLLERLIARTELQTELGPRLRPALAVLAVLVLAGYGYGAHRRNAVWHDEESLWRDDVEKSPHNGRGLMIYGLTQMNKGDYASALDTFKRALVFTPNYATLEINLGVVNGLLADRGEGARAAEAERHFQRAIALSPGDDGPHSYYGRWLSQHGRFAEAIAQLQAAIALDPPRPMQHDLLIQAYLHAGDPQAAQRAAQETLAFVPDDGLAQQTLRHPQELTAADWINLSLSQYKQAAYPQAVESARKALQLDPNSVEAYTNIGAAYGAMQQWDEAIRNEREALRLRPDYQLAKNNLNLYLQLSAGGGKQPENAQPSADSFINDSLRLNQAGDYPRSLAAARKALELNPNSAEAWNNIAADDEALHRWDEAIAAARKAIALKPDFQLAKNNLAWSLAQKAARD